MSGRVAAAERAMLTVKCTWECGEPGQLAPGDLHVWRAVIRGGATPEANEVLLPSERQQAARFQRAQDRARYVEARAMLRRLVARYSAAAPHEIEFRLGTHGKPEIRSPRRAEGIEFNVSHSGDIVLLAFSLGIPVGVDVEALRSINNATELASRYFSCSEREAVEASRDRAATFLQFWTLKEAYVKATGAGITALETVEVSLAPPGARIVAPKSGWHARTMVPKEGYVAALVYGDPRHAD